MEDTGDSVGNGTAAQCGNRDSESKILCGNGSFYDSCADGILAGYAAASDPVSAAIINSVLLVFRTTPFTAADLRLVKYAATLLTTYLTWWQIILMAAATVAVILFCVLLWRKAPVDQHKVNLTESGCVAAVTMLVIWGMLNFSVASGRVALHFGNIGQAYKDYGVA